MKVILKENKNTNPNIHIKKRNRKLSKKKFSNPQKRISKFLYERE